jgi:periodic tryptophan protein 1
MLSSTTWVPRGFASEFPEQYELNDEEMERINKLAQLEIDDAKQGIKALQEDSDEDVEEPKATKLQKQVEIDDDLKEYDLEHYDDEVDGNGEPVSMFPGLSGEVEFHEGEDEEDPYITLPNEEELQEDKQESHIYPTDNLVLATRTEDDVSYLDVYIYDDGAGAPQGAEEEDEDKKDPDVARGMQRDSSLYVHHDLMLPAFPLCVEWINYRSDKDGSDNVGNFAAIGTFDPQIEIWNLDCLDKAFPDVILGEPSSNSYNSIKSKKKKKTKSQHVTTHHTDAVLSLSHNKYHRNVLASTSADHTVKLWDLNQATAVRSINTIHSKKNVSSSQWHPEDGAILLTGGYDSRVAVSDVRISNVDEMSKFWTIGSEDIENVSWSTSEQFIAGTDQGNVYAFDIRNESKPLWTLQAHDAGISSLQVNKHIPDLLVTSAMGEKAIKLWKIPTGDSKKGPSMVLSRDFGVGNVLTTSFAPDIEVAGHVVVGGVNKGLKMFDVFSNRAVRTSFKDSLRALQKAARDQAKENGRASRIARKYQGDYVESVMEVESAGEESEDDGEMEE